MNETDRDYELDRLKTTISKIKEQLLSGANSYNSSQDSLRNTLGDYWDNIGKNAVDEAQLVEAIERQKIITAAITHRYKQLKKMISAPYFGRIDFVEKHLSQPDPEKIYIGISTLTEQETGELLVYDWRSPVAGMYYDFERGEAWYNCPAGTISGVITLKRQYKIVNSIINYMFDSDLKIDDEMLQVILGKSADEKMHSIVTSIQREQNQIIRDPGHRLLFVQGPAGSGKTSIALHRVAYLLYQDRDTVTAKNVLILSPNHIFSDYISNVLPEIGEENVLQTTFQDYVALSQQYLPIQIEGRSEHLEYLLSNPYTKELRTRIANIRYKSSIDFEHVIQNFLDFLDKRLVLDYPDIKIGDQIIFSHEDWQYYYLSSLTFLPVMRRLAKIREIIQLRMRPMVRELRLEKAAEIDATAEEVNEKTIRALARISARNELSPITAEIENLTLLNPLALYQQLFEDKELFHNFAAGKKVPEQWPEIKNQTMAWLQTGQMPYEDSFPFLYFQWTLEGFPTKQEIKHLIIDEAQDYTTLQYKIMACIFPNCSWTILGDPAQAVHPYIQTADFTSASQIINKEDPVFFQLTRSYRSTREIQSFCQALLPPTMHADVINRPGPLPQLVRIKHENMLPVALSKAIDVFAEEGWHSIAIIGKTIQDCTAIYRTLNNQTKLTLITNEDDEFPRGAVVIPAYLAKGLEFDAVLVPNVDSDTYGQDAERNILYTVCTRALHRLSLFYSDDLSPFVNKIPNHLYHSPINFQ